MIDLRTLADGAAAAWADAPEEFKPLLRDCADALVQAAEELDGLRAYVEADCRCPRCEAVRHCMGNCTFLSDSMNTGHDNDYHRMMRARKALWGDNTKGQTE